jgi:hemerythrin-like metal-binding protein
MSGFVSSGTLPFGSPVVLPGLQQEIHMTLLTWCDTLTLGYPPMDDLHKQFVDKLTDVDTCANAELPGAWSALIDCTQRLFDRENNWMTSTHFSSANIHTMQHKVVLNVMREGLAQARAGHTAEVRKMAAELASWFAKHIQSLDAALALHMKSSGLTGDAAPTVTH